MPTATLPTIHAVNPVRLKADAVLTGQAAQDVARQALEELTPAADVGAYVGAAMEAERLATLAFECDRPGYRGWYWTVTVARPPRARTATVCESDLLPGDSALLAKPWVPWSERLQPGDLGPGDVLPFSADDPRLEPGMRTDPAGTILPDDASDARTAAVELGLGMERTLSPEGRAQAAQRWWDGSGGPMDPVALKAKAHCASCGFFVPLTGSLSTLFGVCANEWSPSDGQVVALTHGCGAHSQTDVARAVSEWPAPEPMLDDARLELVDIPGSVPETLQAVVETISVADDAAPVAADPASTVPPSPATAPEPTPERSRAEREVAAAVAELFAAASLLHREHGERQHGGHDVTEREHGDEGAAPDES